MSNIQHSQIKGVQYLSLCAADMDYGQFIQILHLQNKIIFCLVYNCVPFVWSNKKKNCCFHARNISQNEVVSY